MVGRSHTRLIVFLLLCACTLASKTASRPNFLIFFADDLGYGDVTYLAANNTVRKPANTPHIDALARNGINFKAAYAAEAVCTPSRSAMLTGRLPVRSGMASSDPDFRTMMSPAQKTGIPHNEYTIAEALKDQGYATGLIGKWHLGIGATGEHLPTDHGFDYYYGMPVSNVQTCGGKNIFKEPNSFIFTIVRLWNIWVSMLSIVIVTRAVRLIGNKMFLFSLFIVFISILFAQWYIDNITLCARMSCLLYRNKEVVEQPVILENLTLRLTHEAMKFLERQTEDTPWLLKMSYVKVHTALFTSELYRDKSGVGAFGDNVAELDWSVGKIMDALERNGFLENTLVIFSSDNGPYLEREHEGGNSGYVVLPDGKQQYLKGGKGQNWEGGIRVPTIAYWANHIPSKVVEQPISLMDFYPTFLHLAGHPGVSDRPIDGKDLSKILFVNQGEEEEILHDYLFHWCGNTFHAIRNQKYKMHYITPIWDEGTQHCDSVVICQCAGRRLEYHTRPLLYNIMEDPGEQNPIHPETEEYKQVFAEFEKARKEHATTLVPVVNQLESFPRPWIMPCCNNTGADCSCFENNYDFKYLLSDDITFIDPNYKWRNIRAT